MRLRKFSSGCFLFLSLLSIPAFAAQRAVEAVNYEFGLTNDHYDFADDDNGDLYRVVAGVNMPVTDALGFSIFGEFGKYRVDMSGASYHYKWSQTYASATTSVFLRDPDIGRVGFGYSQMYFGSTNANGYDVTSSTSNCPEALAEYYFTPVTVGAWRMQCRNADDADDRVNDSGIYARWYVTPHIGVSAAVYGMDAKDVYGAAVEFQPGYAANSLGFRLGYLRDDDSDINTVALAFRYYFGTRVDLKTRDRRYRSEFWTMQ